MSDDPIIFFLREFRFVPDPYLTILYPAGVECEVSPACADLAVAGGYATFSDFAEDDLFAEQAEPDILDLTDRAD